MSIPENLRATRVVVQGGCLELHICETESDGQRAPERSRVGRGRAGQAMPAGGLGVRWYEVNFWELSAVVPGPGSRALCGLHAVKIH